MQVELRYFIALARAGIGDVHAHFGCSAGRNLRRLDAQIVEFEGGVAQAVAEREQRLAVPNS